VTRTLVGSVRRRQGTIGGSVLFGVWMTKPRTRPTRQRISSKKSCSWRRSPSTACAACTELVVTLDRPFELHPDVALRPEPFGALAYHYGNRRLIFLKHPDVVAVVERLGSEPSVQAAFETCGVARSRWKAFVDALTSLERSEVVRERAG
jgi:mycofactocin biosynthesis protein MftB